MNTRLKFLYDIIHSNIKDTPNTTRLKFVFVLLKTVNITHYIFQYLSVFFFQINI